MIGINFLFNPLIYQEMAKINEALVDISVSLAKDSFDWGGFLGSIAGVLGAWAIARWQYNKAIEDSKEQFIRDKRISTINNINNFTLQCVETYTLFFKNISDKFNKDKYKYFDRDKIYEDINKAIANSEVVAEKIVVDDILSLEGYIDLTNIYRQIIYIDNEYNLLSKVYERNKELENDLESSLSNQIKVIRNDYFELNQLLNQKSKIRKTTLYTLIKKQIYGLDILMNICYQIKIVNEGFIYIRNENNEVYSKIKKEVEGIEDKIKELSELYNQTSSEIEVFLSME